MREKINDISVNQIIYNIDHEIFPKYKSKNYNKFIIISYKKNNSNRTVFDIKFVNTDFISHDVYIGQIRTGNIKDLNCPFVCGVGYLGDNYYECKCDDPILYKKLYDTWTNMLKRCYCDSIDEYRNYGEKGIKVSKRWHSFSNFYWDCKSLKGFDRDKVISGELTLDKDKSCKNASKKKYSHKKCQFLSPVDQYKYSDHTNMKLKTCKKCKAIFENGHIEYFDSLADLSNKYNLDSGDCSRCANGHISHVKNIKIEFID